MAKPIEFTPHIATPQERLHGEIESSAPALEESLELLRQLYEHGVLELMIKLVRGTEGLAEGALKALGSEGMITGMRSLVEVVRLLGQVNPEDLRLVATGLSSGIEQGTKATVQEHKISPLELPKLLMDSDVQLALGTLFGVLKGFGAGLREAAQEAQSERPKWEQRL